ncbi:MAG: 4-(cytidine 5'-diphospho)-2-C-methyl-D-erythritol kinase [Bacillales bacterium]
MILKANAKINISLNVVGKNNNGLHNIESIILPIDLHDSIEIEVNNKHKYNDDFVVCDDYRVGNAKYNLCHKALNIAREKWGFTDFFNVFIHKNIFINSGLGGGSADAAAIIRFLINYYHIEVNQDELRELLKEIGSDVPVMYLNKPAYVYGEGQFVEPFIFNSAFNEYKIFLIKPKGGLSTQKVYSLLDEKDYSNFNIKLVQKYLMEGNPLLKEVIGNSLEQPAFELLPELNILKNELQDFGFDYAFMSGSGSCLVALTNNKKLLSKAEKYYCKKKNYEFEITKFLK